MFKLVINNKGKAYSKELNDQESQIFINKKIKDKVSGNTLGFKNYEFEITGGSDKDGFPMRFDLPGTARKKLLLSKGPGVKIKRKGMRKRKTLRGNVIAQDIKQININVVKEGDKKLDEIFPKKEEGSKESPKEEKPKEEVKKEPKEKKEEEKK
jgi:small subunit ribosomal protein S6e